MAPPVNFNLTPLPTRWSERLSGPNARPLQRIGLGLVLLVLVLVIGLTLGRQADYRVLYSNLSDKDGGAIIAQLSQMNVPYKYTEGGGAILVPSERLHDARLRLASLGLPKGSVQGFEGMETHRLGITQFQERLGFQRGLEGELTRSIQSLSSVRNARVHLALPQQNGFFREQQKPSASVLLSLYPGRGLEGNQIAGIVYLVASAVPEMLPAAVSVLDDSGKLLSTSHTGEAQTAVPNAAQLQYVQNIEQSYNHRILGILEPIVGRHNVRTQVGVEVDFSQIESTSESHKPNQATADGALRSQQLIENTQSGSTPLAQGVPGATSNQPPAPASAPINAASQASGGNSANTSASGSSRRESVVNYEVDKTVKVVKASSGNIKRLTAAVVLNHQTSAGSDGKAVLTALSEQQLEQMTSLVREAIGFNKERGDSISLMNTPFNVEKPVFTEFPWWRSAESIELGRSLIWPTGTVLLATLVVFGLLRPAFKTFKPAALSPPRPQVLDAVLADDPQRVSLNVRQEPRGPSSEELQLEDARKLTRDNPAAVASIVKGWINVDSTN